MEGECVLGKEETLFSSFIIITLEAIHSKALTTVARLNMRHTLLSLSLLHTYYLHLVGDPCLQLTPHYDYGQPYMC